MWSNEHEQVIREAAQALVAEAGVVVAHALVDRVRNEFNARGLEYGEFGAHELRPLVPEGTPTEGFTVGFLAGL